MYDDFSKENEVNGTKEKINITNTESGLDDGQIKCPKCGATDISTDAKTGQLRCNFCRHRFELDLIEKDDDISSLKGTTIGSGASDIAVDSKDVITLKCQSCGAEVVIDTTSSTQARCHWCRNTLSLNKQIPNGAVPDMVLPFKITKKEAEAEIANFVNKRKFFAHPTFTKEFTTKNICGVYFPYMVVDVNGHMRLSGEGEIETDCRTVKRGDNEVTIYDADVYHVERDFDIAIDDLCIESSSDKLDYSSKNKTTNIINSIMPFDTENCVKYNANYLKGYTSEKRDTNITELKQLADAESADIARVAAKDSIERYDRGVRWDSENFAVKGDSWKAAYLPVWLYSYMQKKGNDTLLHYVAVNARTKETMGSVPINTSKLMLFSILIELFGGSFAYMLGSIFNVDSNYRWLLLLTGFAFYLVMYLRYRNSDARHTYESETRNEVSNMQTVDNFIEHLTDLEDSSIDGENSSVVTGNNLKLNGSELLKRAMKKGININEIIDYKKKLEDIDDKTKMF